MNTLKWCLKRLYLETNTVLVIILFLIDFISNIHRKWYNKFLLNANHKLLKDIIETDSFRMSRMIVIPGWNNNW